jgi:hypothetical protein
MYTYTMERTQIYLNVAESTALEHQSARTGRSRSQLIREAIDRIYLGESNSDALTVLESTAGAWKGRRETGANFVQGLRRRRLSGYYS